MVVLDPTVDRDPADLFFHHTAESFDGKGNLADGCPSLSCRRAQLVGAHATLAGDPSWWVPKSLLQESPAGGCRSPSSRGAQLTFSFHHIAEVPDDPTVECPSPSCRGLQLTFSFHHIAEVPDGQAPIAGDSS